jgi:hypothetical protein
VEVATGWVSVEVSEDLGEVAAPSVFSPLQPLLECGGLDG